MAPRPLLATLVVVTLAVLAGAGERSSTSPRRALRQEPWLPAEGVAGVQGWRLVVKPADRLRARATPQGTLVSEAATPMHALRALARREGLRFRPLLDVDPARLAELEGRARARSGRAQPDLAGLVAVETDGRDAEALSRLARALARLSEVEFAHLEALGVPPPGDVAPPTPDLSPMQGYLGPLPGLEVAWGRAQGHRGQGVRLSDCEYGWNPTHEDLVDRALHLEAGQTIHPSVFANGWDSHGTAALGSIAAPDNGYGATGIAEQAETYTFPEWTTAGFRRASAIASALAGSRPGDVVLLEMQTVGPGGGYAPAELDPSVFLLVRAGVDAGIVVVAAAGNGDQDLDSAPYAAWRAWGDSGAILVGAGSGTSARSKLSFSTHGSRVDLQGWGQDVLTLGYGDLAQYGGDPDQRYTGAFDGTSSASALVAGVCVQVQSAALDHGGVLPPTALRELLAQTGRPQGGGGGNVGPLPDSRAAIESLDSLLAAGFLASAVAGKAPFAVAFTDTSFGAVSAWAWDFGDGATSSARHPLHTYLQPGVYDVRLTVTGPAGSAVHLRPGLVTVAQAPLSVARIGNGPLPALLPGTGQEVSVGGAGFSSVVAVEVDRQPLPASSWSAVDDATLALNPPQLASLGAHTLTVRSATASAELPFTVVAPATPALQVGDGDGFATNAFTPATGVPILAAGAVGSTHWVLYSTSPGPSVLPGLVSLSIGGGFAELELVAAVSIPAAGWTQATIPFTPVLLLAWLQSFSLDQGFPLAVSNVQSVLLQPF